MIESQKYSVALTFSDKTHKCSEPRPDSPKQYLTVVQVRVPEHPLGVGCDSQTCQFSPQSLINRNRQSNVRAWQTEMDSTHFHPESRKSGTDTANQTGMTLKSACPMRTCSSRRTC